MRTAGRGTSAGSGNRANQYLQADRKQPMEMGQPLTRFALVKDDTGIFKWFVWTVHHALYDGWSMPLIVNVVNQAYRVRRLSIGISSKRS